MFLQPFKIFWLDPRNISVEFSALPSGLLNFFFLLACSFARARKYLPFQSDFLSLSLSLSLVFVLSSFSSCRLFFLPSSSKPRFLPRPRFILANFLFPTTCYFVLSLSLSISRFFALLIFVILRLGYFCCTARFYHPMFSLPRAPLCFACFYESLSPRVPFSPASQCARRCSILMQGGRRSCF